MLIKDRTMKNSILRALADPIDTEIIRIVGAEARPVADIVEQLQISTSSTYRRLKNLEETGIVFIERFLEENTGTPSNRYRASFSHINVSFNHNETTIDAEPTTKVIEQTYHLFSTLRNRGRKL